MLSVNRHGKQHRITVRGDRQNSGEWGGYHRGTGAVTNGRRRTGGFGEGGAGVEVDQYLPMPLMIEEQRLTNGFPASQIFVLRGSVAELPPGRALCGRGRHGRGQVLNLQLLAGTSPRARCHDLTPFHVRVISPGAAAR